MVDDDDFYQVIFQVVGDCRCELYVRRHSLVGVYDSMNLYTAFFPPLLGWRPTPLNNRFEKSEIVVESIICRRFIYFGVLPLRLSEERTAFAHG